MSFNIRYGTARDGANAWPDRRELVFDVVRTFEPDVLGIQEALDFQVDQLAEALPGFEIVGVGRDDGARRGEFAALLVRRSRIEVVEHGTFWFSDTPRVPGSRSWGNRIPRICTWARLRDRTTDRAFYVYNLHWDHESQPSRERSAELLLERMADRSHPEDPVLVTGDFNAGETNPAFRTLVEAPDLGLRDTFRDVHPAATEVGTFHGFEGRREGEKIDAILASEGWCTVSAAIVRDARDGRFPSDHFPVTAEVRRGRSGACA
ncbi:MAG: endonuclease/exonuclease/phosphatase family protein, partial [Gemmatimonadota bacterium]|nr:endonuclease/exonuclease/phosphatase family protein [Gemmatimonadota bacterium]